jgi:molybdate transport repressor ModE-like protein
MNKLHITPAWVFRSDDNYLFDVQMFDLLGHIHEHQKLTVAAKKSGISYRHAWNLLNRWQAFFGLPLVNMQKGQGTRLSTLGDTLLWGEQRLQARLGPQTESMASELNMELQQLLEGVHPVLRMHASHGYAVALLATFGEELELNLQYCNPEEALLALNRGDCDVAGFHLPTDPAFAQHILTKYQYLLDSESHSVIRFITRQQGLMTRPESSHSIKSLPDLTLPNVRFINRQRASGTRDLLNLLLARDGIAGHNIAGFEREEYTHTAVAAYVASNMADAGFGVEAAARQFGLAFTPLASEQYLLICQQDRLQDKKIQRLLTLLQSPHFVGSLDTLPGYLPDRCGTVESLAAIR